MTVINRRHLLRRAAASAAAAVVAKEALTTPVAYGAHKKLGKAVSLDGRPFPDYDYARANKLPREMTGYWEKSFDIGGLTRTVKIYISPETPIRSYYTVIAVPDGVDTAEFLRKSAWRDVAGARKGCSCLSPARTDGET